MEENILYTIPSTGVEIKLRKVSPLLMVDLRSVFPPPKPPTQIIETPLGGKREEVNPSDPDYMKLLLAYETEQTQRGAKIMIKRGVLPRELTEEEKVSVDELRSFWLSEFGSVLPGSDWDIFLSYIAIQTPSDLEGVMNAITRRSQPTEEAIKQHTDSFRD